VKILLHSGAIFVKVEIQQSLGALSLRDLTVDPLNLIRLVPTKESGGFACKTAFLVAYEESGFLLYDKGGVLNHDDPETSGIERNHYGPDDGRSQAGRSNA
jgi:hypothetical protein